MALNTFHKKNLLRPATLIRDEIDAISEKGYSFSETISAEVVADLRALAERERINPVAVALAAFGILIHRYTRGEAEIAIKISVVNDNLRFHVSGPWHSAKNSNNHVIHLALRDDMSLEEALRHVSSTVSSILPVTKNVGSVSFEWCESGNDDGGILSATLKRSGRFVTEIHSRNLLRTSEPVLRIGSHWQALLAGLNCDPGTPISLLPVMDAEERTTILRDWSGDAFDQKLSRSEYLHEIFEAQAAANPERKALICDGCEMTYGELNLRADKLAGYLQSRGVGAGSFVGIYMPRNMDLYVSILGVLKSGAAYVPIDPECPQDRVEYMANDCKVAAMLTTSDMAENLSSSSLPLILVDREWASIQDQSYEALEASGVTPGSIAYIIYTSGSTGRPKGVLIEHKSVCNFVRSEGRIFHIHPEDRVFQGFSVAFDASLEEIWLAFSSGATLVVGTDEMVHAGPALAKMLADAGVTVLSCVPTLLSMMDDDIPSLRLLILGGEQCPKDLVARWWKKGRRVVNTYGPTEATVVSTYADCYPGDPITIGKPIPNYYTYILDSNLQPVPAGVAGELHIGGVCLSRGYLNRDDLTDQKFISNPFIGEPGAPHKLYKTGDLVRYTANGDIEFLGRIDAQVKLRGFRIELAEIESVLMRRPDVRSAVVSLREDIPGIQQLVAYVIPSNSCFDEGAARDTLRSCMPAYMVPSHFVLMSDFPVFASGKVDRKRLPAPECRTDETRNDVVGARTETERIVLRVWEKLFSPQNVSVTDNFFDLGGHSLLAARMVSELRNHAGMRHASMLDVYNHPTLEAFARKLEESAPTCEDSSRSESVDSVEAKSKFHVASRASFYLCAAAQALSIYALAGIFMIPLLISYRVYISLAAKGHGVLLPILAACGISLAIFPFVILLCIASKWIIIGRYKSGSYPVWGAYYFRFWLARKIQATMPLTYLRGTTLLPIYYRLMGAKIGSNVYLGTQNMFAYDLLTIGDDTSIGIDAQLLGYHIENGMLHIGTTSIGKRCYVGAKSVVYPGSTMYDDSMLDELSMLPSDSIVPRGEIWAGSPARFASRRSAELPAVTEKSGSGILYGIVYALMVLFVLPALPLAATLPGAIVLVSMVLKHGTPWVLLWSPIMAASFVVLFALEIALLKWAVGGRIAPGKYRVRSPLYIKKWFVDSMMQMGLELLHPLYATLYLPPWFRLLGAKLGKRVEVSTVAHITPELLSIDDESFIADSACMGATRVNLGWFEIADVSIGKRTFVGNSALIPAGTRIGNESLVGVLSIPPKEEILKKNPASSWLGSPSVRLPNRQDSAVFPDSMIFSPPWYLYLLRGTIEFFRVTMPSSLLVLMLAAFIRGTVMLSQVVSLPVLLLALPGLFIGSAALATLVVVAIKWAVMGRYRPCTRPLWSSFVWRTEMVTALHESFASPALLNTLQGTPFLSLYFRLMGSRIGKRVCMETTQITEFDLVNIGDDAALNLNCTVQTHLFEDRVMKCSNLYMGDKTSVGTMSVVLYDSEMQEGASLSGLSLLMKGENLPPWTCWEGITARPRM